MKQATCSNPEEVHRLPRARGLCPALDTPPPPSLLGTFLGALLLWRRAGSGPASTAAPTSSSSRSSTAAPNRPSLLLFAARWPSLLVTKIPRPLCSRQGACHDQARAAALCRPRFAEPTAWRHCGRHLCFGRGFGSWRRCSSAHSRCCGDGKALVLLSLALLPIALAAATAERRAARRSFILPVAALLFRTPASLAPPPPA